jgi:hypothetical protein
LVKAEQVRRNITIKQPLNQNRMKKETLEEAAQSIAIHCNGIFIPGAEWQAERMYSEEQVLYILNELHKSPHALMDVSLKEWFEQFKNK